MPNIVLSYIVGSSVKGGDGNGVGDGVMISSDGIGVGSLCILNCSSHVIRS